MAAGANSDANETLYSVLGVPPDASEADIKRAYHDAAKLYHPGVRVCFLQRRIRHTGTPPRSLLSRCVPGKREATRRVVGELVTLHLSATYCHRNVSASRAGMYLGRPCHEIDVVVSCCFFWLTADRCA